MAMKSCFYCGKIFLPDPRVGNRQKACSHACQRLRKRENNKSFSRKNPGYWRGRYEYLKQWRLTRPGYQRQWRQRRKVQKKVTPSEIQAEKLSKAIELTERTQFYLREIQAEFIPKPSLEASLIYQAP
jgi:hypothetical protein